MSIPALIAETGDEENLYLAGDTATVDRINGGFYGSFPYPWRPQNFLYPADSRLMTTALCQSIGDWEHRRLPARPSIWIAGCGTNQAAQIALQFPLARIVGSDLSAPSLELCAQTLRSMGLSNVELRHESLNNVGYDAEFDLVISTGVIHHNADPVEALRKLHRALKPGGLMELMVYNRFHRLMNTAVQKAIRLLSENVLTTWPEQMELLQQVIGALPPESRAAAHLKQLSGEPDARVADSLLQPVEHTYTVESLERITSACGLDLITPRISEWDKVDGHTRWNMSWSDASLQQRYNALPDRIRWQITNLLLAEESPMLWFYLQRKDAPYPVLGEAEMTQAFLDRHFILARNRQRCFLQAGDYYKLSPAILAAVSVPYEGPWEALSKSIGLGLTPREAMGRMEYPTGFSTANLARLYLTTTSFFHLQSVAPQA
jgi:SAM-dependent methyltransferase